MLVINNKGDHVYGVLIIVDDNTLSHIPSGAP